MKKWDEQNTDLVKKYLFSLDQAYASYSFVAWPKKS